MQVSAIDGASAAQPGSRTGPDGASSAPPGGGGVFESALREQARRSAARDLLAAMPPPLAHQIARESSDGTPPVPGVHEMFVAVQDGSFVLGERERRSPFWRALDTAAREFESADAMWSTMRKMPGAPEQIAAAVSAVSAVSAAGATPSPVAGAAPEVESDALAVLGGSLPAWQLGWWEWTLEHVLREERGQT